MQDKEFDELFRSNLGDAEVQPSAKLWDNIAKELEPRKRSILPIYWMAAAVVLLTIAAGLLLPEQEKIRLQGSALAGIPAPTATEVRTGATKKQTVAQQPTYRSTPLIIAPRLNEADVKKDFAAVQPKVVKVHPVNMEPEIVKPVASNIIQEPAIPENEIVIASTDVPDEYNAIAESETAERKGIRNVGDIVNYVVDKVDKREKKFIKFNTDDDNSSVVAINIGIIKFNKRSDK